MDLVDSGEIDAAAWRAIVPARLARAKGEPYVLLAAVAHKGGAVNNDFAGGAEVLLSSSLGDDTRIAALTAPANPVGWLRRLVQRSRLDGLSLGLAYASDFPGGGGARPSSRAAHRALDAARHGTVGWLMMDRRAVEALRLDAAVQDVDEDADGRPTSLLKFSG